MTTLIVSRMNLVNKPSAVVRLSSHLPRRLSLTHFHVNSFDAAFCRIDLTSYLPLYLCLLRRFVGEADFKTFVRPSPPSLSQGDDDDIRTGQRGCGVHFSLLSSLKRMKGRTCIILSSLPTRSPGGNALIRRNQCFTYEQNVHTWLRCSLRGLCSDSCINTIMLL